MDAFSLLSKTKIDCLDKGFVEIVDVMPRIIPDGQTCDYAICQAARVSYGQGTKSVNEDKGLIRYLMRHSHTTPNEMIDFKFLMKMPLFIARQMFRHRTACLSGDSLLYFDEPAAIKNNKRKSRRMSIYELYDKWHNGAKPIKGRWGKNVIFPLRKQLSKMNLRSCDEITGEIKHTNVTDIWQTGLKDVFEVELDNGYKLKMTKDHLCLTKDGWFTLEEATNLKVGINNCVTWMDKHALFAVNGTLCYQDKNWLAEKRSMGLSIMQIANDADISYHSIRKYLKKFDLQYVSKEKSALSGKAQKGQKRNGIRKKPLSQEHINNIKLARSGSNSNFWNDFLSIKNVRHENKKLPKTRKLVRTFSKIKKITYLGKEMTYDLSVSGPFHNFVCNGFIVHNSVNEISGRYSVMKDEFYIPDVEDLRKQSTTNKQGGEEAFDKESSQEFVDKIDLSCKDAYSVYLQMLDAGVSREQARMILPLNLYTEFYWKQDLHNLLHLLSLRADAHAQKEIRVYADAILELITPLVPWTIEAWNDYHPMREAISLTKLEKDAISNSNLQGNLAEIASENKREQAEWQAKIKELFPSS
jgi:thymidylate synthase (FAD)